MLLDIAMWWARREVLISRLAALKIGRFPKPIAFFPDSLRPPGGILQGVRLSRKFPYGRVLEPEVVYEVVEVVRDTYFVGRGVEGAFVVLSEGGEGALDIRPDLL